MHKAIRCSGSGRNTALLVHPHASPIHEPGSRHWPQAGCGGPTCKQIAQSLSGAILAPLPWLPTHET